MREREREREREKEKRARGLSNIAPFLSPQRYYTTEDSNKNPPALYLDSPAASIFEVIDAGKICNNEGVWVMSIDERRERRRRKKKTIFKRSGLLGVAVNIFTKTITSGREEEGGGAISNLQKLLNIKEARHIRFPFNSRPIYIYIFKKKRKEKGEIKKISRKKKRAATS